MRPLRVTTAFLLAFLTSGTFLSLMQCVAWTWMLFNYTPDYGLWKSVERTFGGKNPCSLCQEVSSARSEQEKPETKRILIDKKHEPGRIFREEDFFVVRSEAVQWNRTPLALMPSRAEAPPLPPPRYS